MIDTPTDEMTDLPKRPYLAPWYQLVKEDERVLFKSGEKMVVLEGKATQTLLPALLPLLDGTRTVEEIHECIGEAIGPATAKALKLLEEKGLLTEGPPLPLNIPTPIAKTVNFLQSVGQEQKLTANDILRFLKEAKVGIVGTGIVAEEIARLLRFSGVETVRRIDWPLNTQQFDLDLVVVAPQGEELYLLSEWNRFALDNLKPWMQVIPYDGRFAAVGPLYVPGETSCYKCYNLRLAANVDYREELSAWNQAVEERCVLPPEHHAPAQIDLILANLASFHVLCSVTSGQNFNLLNRFYAVRFDPEGFILKQHHIYRVPRCPQCSRLARQGSPLPWYEVSANG